MENKKFTVVLGTKVEMVITLYAKSHEEAYDVAHKSLEDIDEDDLIEISNAFLENCEVTAIQVVDETVPLQEEFIGTQPEEHFVKFNRKENNV